MLDKSLYFNRKTIMAVTKTLLFLFAVCLIIGAIDCLRGNKWKLGERFSAGLQAFEPLFLTMAGIIVLIPCFQKFLTPVLAPAAKYLGMDPGLLSGVFIANDMGGFQLAHSLTQDPRVGNFSGMLLGSVLGVNFVFTLPAALKMVEKNDREYLFKGLLFGFITLPLGCFAGGLTAGYPVLFLLKQLIPVTVIAFLSVLMLWLIPEKLTVLLSKLGRGIEIVALTGIVLAITAELTGFSGDERWLLEPIQEGIKIVGSIVIVLPGAYVFIELLNRGCKNFFIKAGSKLGINHVSVLGMITSLANSIPTFLIVKDMDKKGKVLNFAFLTGGAFALGDHLAFCCAVAPELALPLLVTKFTAAFSALLIVSTIYYKKTEV